ncbi:MAG: hypothetical protein DSY88_05385, partial [Candidatus Poseidoniales archaeon]
EYEPKVVGRTFVVAKPGKRQALVDAFLGIRDKVTPDVKPMVSAPMSGPISAVRVTYFGASLQDLDDQIKEFRGQARSSGVPDLFSQAPVFHLGRVVYRASV